MWRSLLQQGAQAWHVLGSTVGETLNTTGTASHPVRESLSEWVWGYLCFQMKERFGTVSRGVEHHPKQGAWGCVARVSALLCITRPGMTYHSRTQVANHHQLKLRTKSQWCRRAEGTCHRLGTPKCVPGAVFLPHQLRAG